MKPIVLAVICALSLAACGGKKQPDQPKSGSGSGSETADEKQEEIKPMGGGW